MRHLPPLLICALLAAQAAAAQTDARPGGGEAGAVNQSAPDILLDLQALDAEAAKITRPLASARAKAEIADAAWRLDGEWARKLLREAYELTFPDEKERERLRREAAEARPRPPTEIERARSEVRNRVFAVAGRDAAFADELRALGSRELGRVEESERARSLAWQSLRAGDVAAAGRYVSSAVKADPTQSAAWELLPNIAARDRAEADRLLLEYIEQLRAVPLSTANGSALRVHLFLHGLMLGGRLDGGRTLPPPGPAVLKAYAGYVVESLTQLGQREPEGLKSLRTFLVAAWPALRQHAPELTGAFMELERLSRRPGEDAGLPPQRDAQARKADQDEALRQALKGGRFDEAALGLAVGRKDFAAARKLVDLLPDGEKKLRLTDWVNAEESLALSAAGDATAAEGLARSLTQAESVLRVYPVLVGKCAGRKDASCAALLADQAAKQLRRAADGATLASGLGGLASALAPINDGLAFAVLDEAVAAANAVGPGEPESGRPAVEPGIFRALAARDETRARAAAQGLKSRAERITALAATYQRDAEAKGKEAAPRPQS